MVFVIPLVLAEHYLKLESGSLCTTNEKASLFVHAYDWFKTHDQLISCTFGLFPRGGRVAKNWDGIYLRQAQKRLEAYQLGERCESLHQTLMEEKHGNLKDL